MYLYLLWSSVLVCHLFNVVHLNPLCSALAVSLSVNTVLLVFVLFCFVLCYLSIVHWLEPSTFNPSFPFFLLSICLLRLCQSCWRWCVFPSSTRPTCWTWWTMRSWLSRRRRVAIWSTRPSAITCCPTHGKRCRRPGLGRGSLLVHTNSYTWPELNLCASSLAWMTWEQCGSNMICHSPVNLARNIVARPCSGTHIHYLLQQDGGEVRPPQGDLNLPLNCIDFSPQLESNDLELHNVFHTTTVNCEKYTRATCHISKCQHRFFFPQTND